VLEEQATNAKEAAEKKHNDGLKTSLVEIGPRFVMNPIRIFSGSFNGQTLYQNGDFVSPNEVRAEKARELGSTYKDRKMSEKMSKERKSNMVVPEDPLNSVFK
jgi:ribosome biogenesis protein BRX1